MDGPGTVSHSGVWGFSDIGEYYEWQSMYYPGLSE